MKARLSLVRGPQRCLEVGNATVVTFGDDEIPDQQCKGVFFLSCAEVVSDRNQDLAKCGLAEDPLVECVVVRSEIAGLR